MSPWKEKNESEPVGNIWKPALATQTTSKSDLPPGLHDLHTNRLLDLPTMIGQVGLS